MSRIIKKYKIGDLSESTIWDSQDQTDLDLFIVKPSHARYPNTIQYNQIVSKHFHQILSENTPLNPDNIVSCLFMVVLLASPHVVDKTDPGL